MIKNRIVAAIQVTKELTDENRKREISGILEAMNAYDLDEGLILTEDLEDVIEIEGKRVVIKPVWLWLLK